MTADTAPARISGLALDRLIAFLEEQYPQIEDLQLLDLKEFGDGWETDLYHLRIAGAQGLPLELVLRIFGGNEPLVKAQKEYSLLTGVTRFGVATPRVDALVTDLSVLGNPFMVMEHIPGGTLEASVQGEGFSRWLNPMMRGLAQIHSIPWVELLPEPQGPIPNSDEPLAFVKRYLREMDQAIHRHELTSFGPTMDWLYERMALGTATTPALIHNDYHPQNILLKQAQLLIIDWSFAEVSDYRMDLAWTVMLLCVLAGDDQRSAILEAYEHAVGTPVGNFEYFEALKLTMRMLTIATWLDDDVEIPVPGITRQAIRSDYKVHVLNPYRRLKEITDIEIQVIEDL